MLVVVCLQYFVVNLQLCSDAINSASRLGKRPRSARVRYSYSAGPNILNLFKWFGYSWIKKYRKIANIFAQPMTYLPRRPALSLAGRLGRYVIQWARDTTQWASNNITVRNIPNMAHFWNLLILVWLWRSREQGFIADGEYTILGNDGDDNYKIPTHSFWKPYLSVIGQWAPFFELKAVVTSVFEDESHGDDRGN